VGYEAGAIASPCAVAIRSEGRREVATRVTPRPRTQHRFATEQRRQARSVPLLAASITFREHAQRAWKSKCLTAPVDPTTSVVASGGRGHGLP
jgi:hypothetical protein